MRPIAWDTETHLVAPGNLCPKLVCLSYAFAVDDDSCGLFNAADGVDFIQNTLLDTDLIMVAHNGKFDLAVLAAESPDLLPRIFDALEDGRVSDTIIREKLIRLATGEFATEAKRGKGKIDSFSMESIFRHRYNVDMSADKAQDSWRLRFHELDGVPLDKWPFDYDPGDKYTLTERALHGIKASGPAEYAIGDSLRTLHMWLDQCEDIGTIRAMAPEAAEGTAINIMINEPQQVAAAFALHLMGIHGLRTGVKEVSALIADIDKTIDKSRDLLINSGLMRPGKLSLNMANVQETIKQAYEEIGLDAPTTPSGRISTAKETIDEIADMADETNPLSFLSKVKEGGRFKTEYMQYFIQGTQIPICPQWNELLETGRTSCWRPAMQKLPRAGKERACFVPRDGHYYINADYSMIELRALAQVLLDMFGQSEMANMLIAGMDLHVKTAAEYISLRDGTEYTYEDAIADYQAGHKEITDMRQMAKAANFGFPGGLGADKFIAYAKKSYKVKLDKDPKIAREKATMLKKAWFAAFPEMREFFDYISSKGDSFLAIQPRSNRLRADCGFCDGCNTHFQGLAADGAKAALWYIQMECYTGRSPLWRGKGTSPLLDSRLVGFFHDEFLGESKIRVAPEAAIRLGEVMRTAMALYLPDIPIVAEPLLMLAWEKKAKPTFDGNGRLIPWQPAK